MPSAIEIFPGSTDLTIYHLGPPLEAGPLPAFFYFALSGENSLSLDPFNQPVTYLKNESIRCFSFTLPGHGPGLKDTEAIRFWAESFANGHNFIEEFVSKAKANIDLLIERNLIDPSRLAVGGLSRGAFAAGHLAASDERLNTLVGFAPLISLELSEEFKTRLNLGELGLTKNPHHDTILQSSLLALAPELAKKTVRFYIGNRDLLVHTDTCYQLTRQLANLAFENGLRSPPIELRITPSIGRYGHGTAPETFREGAFWIKEMLRII